MSIDILLELSREYGGNPDWVLAGGGNTSVKDEDYLYIKASGHALATLTREGLVAMRRRELARMWRATYPRAPQEREARALADLMAARVPEEAHKRPSVETLMHDALPFSYVIHTHPALVNGVTCARNGQETVGTLFGERALWIPLVDPGYVLAQRVAEELETHRSHTGTDPQVLFLQNHGLVVAGNDPNEMRRLHEHIAATIEARLTRRPDESAVSVDPEQVEALESRLADAFARLSGRGGGEARGASGTPAVSFSTNAEISRMVQSPETFAPISGPYTPDHIVYAGHHPPLATAESPEDAVEEHLRVWGHLPRTIAVEGVGLFAVAGDTRAAERALALAADAVRIAVYAESFGGPRFMDPERVAFIRNWEVERYREKVGSDG